jgi:type IX secretion system PorP/SprF family membrane protein
MFKRGLTIISFTFFGFALKAQQLPLYSQYMLNGFMINSAMAGHDGFSTFNLTTRQQWFGFSYAPRTFSITAQTRILSRSYQIRVKPRKRNAFLPARSGRTGLGISLYNDRNGYFGQTGITFSYAYHIPFPNAQLSLGVSGSIAQYKVNEAGIDFRLPESHITGISEPIYVPDANVGVFYTNNEFYAGFSVASLLQSVIKYGNEDLNMYKMKRHYYAMTGYKFTSERNMNIEPSVLIKTTENLLPQIDFSLKAYYYEKYWFGLSYRTSNALIFNVGLQKGKVYIGYAFDYGFTGFQQNTYGSHELNLSLKFGDNAKRYRWLRRF